MPDFLWILTRLDIRALLDILLVATIFYWLLGVAAGTRAALLIRGLTILTVSVWAASNVFDLSALSWLLSRTWPVLLLAIPVIFQPELRRVLEQIGHTGQWLRTPFAAGADAALERTVDEVSRAAAQLSRRQYGALIVIERETGLQDYADRGVALDATVTRQLLINIFYPGSPLHDGAVVIRLTRILAAAVVLPLTESVGDGGRLGTRHRAAIGITEESDALAVVVSEETGRISVAHNGRIVENLDQERLRRALRSLLKLDRRSDSSQPSSSRPSASRRIRSRLSRQSENADD